MRLGETVGRGRQDRDKRKAESVKGIFMVARDPDWREHPGVLRIDHASCREPGERQGGGEWAETEFGAAKLGQKRCTARLVGSAKLLAECPGRSVPPRSLVVLVQHRQRGSFRNRRADAPQQSHRRLPLMVERPPAATRLRVDTATEILGQWHHHDLPRRRHRPSPDDRVIVRVRMIASSTR